ncbi:MAG: RagB/SusD family nutrient uptake outer membrane protein, partial [Bacteroidota bacterium]|nr:RagB/SusD family nutrient uptake outer membrane protein [Bacteroidota bacterium]
MKKLIYNVIAIASAALLMSSCESFLDTKNLTQATTDNYPQTADQAKQVVTGIYNPLSLWNANPQMSFLYISQLASDDCLGGGGENDKLMQSEDLLMNNGTNMLLTFWTDTYKGVQRANTAIETLGKCTGYASDDQKNQLLGEAYFLRAFYYYQLASLFENIPLTTSSAATELPQSAPDATWGQIISDLKQAITLMPAKQFGSGWVESGHADKWNAEAMMGRAFLFYTGFYNKTDVTLPDNSKVTKADVVTWIDDCVNNSGYSLVPDYRNLWGYTNRLTVNDYAWTK